MYDIFNSGTGASCIYPLLAAKINGWKMTATETVADSVNCAIENAEKNNLSSLITGKINLSLTRA